MRQFPRRLEARHARHADVEDGEVDVLREGSLDGRSAVGGLRDDIETGSALITCLSPSRTRAWSSATRILVTSGIGIAPVVPARRT